MATVTFLWSGTITHRDTLGSVQDITAGDVNWMTAGRGIAHSERTPLVRVFADTLNVAIDLAPDAELAIAPSHPERAPRAGRRRSDRPRRHPYAGT